MLKIRFQRTGRKNDPAFRIVVTEHTRGPKAGNHVAVVGSYHPKTKHTVIDGDAIKDWMGKGAKTSGTVHNLLVSKGILEGDKINVLPKKSPIVKEQPKKSSEQSEEKKEVVGKEPEEKPTEDTAEPTEEEVAADPETEPASAEKEPTTDEQSETVSGEEKAEESPEEPKEDAPTEEPPAEEKSEEKPKSE